MLIAQYLPLLKILRSLSKQQQKIVLNHLDSKSTESFLACISRVIYPAAANLSKRKAWYLSKKFYKDRSKLKKLMKKTLSAKQKKDILLTLGSETVLHILKIAVPFISKLIRNPNGETV